jgi:hypothetical protein
VQQKRLITLLAAGAPGEGGPGPDCPDELQVAAYVDGTLTASERQDLARHLADCGHCLAMVATLCAERRPDRTSAADVPSRPVAARHPPALGAPSSIGTSWLSPRWAAAAALFVALPLGFYLGASRDEAQRVGSVPVARTLVTGHGTPQVLVETIETGPNADKLSFSWTPVEGSPYYDVRIVTDVGDVVIEQRVTGTSWRPPPRLALQAGRDYYVHVDAYPAGDMPVGSGHVGFTVPD